MNKKMIPDPCHCGDCWMCDPYNRNSSSFKEGIQKYQKGFYDSNKKGFANHEDTLSINVKRLSPEAITPRKFTKGASGVDLFSVDTETIHPKERKLIHTGIAIELPIGYEAQIRPRSGLALKYGVTVLNTPGTIDADYRGEICAILYNAGEEPFYVLPGNRIAQMVIREVQEFCFNEVDELSETSRGDGGFGHTGTGI